jgi:hypothetical protein
VESTKVRVLSLLLLWGERNEGTERVPDRIGVSWEGRKDGREFSHLVHKKLTCGE